MRVHNFDTVEFGRAQRNFRHVTPICILSLETDSVPLNLRKCWRPKCTNDPRRGDKAQSREGTHFEMCVIDARSLVSSIYSRCWSWPPCPNLIGSVNLNQVVIQRQEEREAKAQAAKRQTNNYEGQSLSESKEIKARKPRMYIHINLVPRPFPLPTTCFCILQATKNWSRGKPENEITSIPHVYVY